MKNILAENMIRFRVKNLSESTICFLLEQNAEQNVTADQLDYINGPVEQRFKNPDTIPVPADQSWASSISTKAENLTEKNENTRAGEQQTALAAHAGYDFLMNALAQKNQIVNATFWFLGLTQETRIALLDQTVAYMNQNGGFTKQLKNFEKEKGKFPVTALITKGAKTKTTTQQQKLPAIKPIKIPFERSGGGTYTDNSYDPGPDLQTTINQWTTDVQNALNAARAVNPGTTATCTLIEVATSCSRLRNTGKFKDETWASLSEARASRVYEILAGNLSQLKVQIAANAKSLKGGWNGDGSSGPDPAQTYTFNRVNPEGERTSSKTTGMGYSTDGANRYPKEDDAGPGRKNTYTTPDGEKTGLLQNDNEADQHKWCMVNVVIEITAPGVDQLTKPGVIEARGYSVEFSTNMQDVYTFKLNDFEYTVTGGDPATIERKLNICPAFD